VVSAGFERIEQGLADAGLTFEDLSKPQTLLELDQQTLQQLQQELQSLDTPRFDNALTSISEHAQQECGVDLGGRAAVRAAERRRRTWRFECRTPLLLPGPVDRR
jgi:hypothetical protein